MIAPSAVDQQLRAHAGAALPPIPPNPGSMLVAYLRAPTPSALDQQRRAMQARPCHPEPVLVAYLRAPTPSALDQQQRAMQARPCHLTP